MRARAAISRAGGVVLVGPVDCKIQVGGLTVVLGPNGAGKTSLLRMLHGIGRLSSGTIEWAGGTAQARRAQSFVFQRPTMLRRTVEANVAFPLRLTGVARAEAHARSRDALARVGLRGLADRAAHGLSGGEMQKLAIARALVTEPELLFLDEPCVSLDGAATREIEQILREAVEAGTRVVMCTHDVGQARRLATEIWFMLRGRLHEAGPADAFFRAPTTPEARAFIAGDIVT